MENSFVDQIKKITTLKGLEPFLELISKIIEQTDPIDISIIAGNLLELCDRGQVIGINSNFDEYTTFMAKLQLICDKFENKFPNQDVWKDYSYDESYESDEVSEGH